jgi:hypothetical protein
MSEIEIFHQLEPDARLVCLNECKKPLCNSPSVEISWMLGSKAPPLKKRGGGAIKVRQLLQRPVVEGTMSLPFSRGALPNTIVAFLMY